MPTADQKNECAIHLGDGKDSVILLVNNLGGLPLIELMLIVNEASKWLAKKDIAVERFVCAKLRRRRSS